jgi:endoglucanase
MVRRVTNDGYLTMQMLGGWLDQALWTSATSSDRGRAGDHGYPRHCIVPQEERSKVYPRESIFLTGEDRAEAAAMGLPGDPVPTRRLP